MRQYLLPAAIVWSVAQSAAFAASASTAYSDVPAGHWAEAAVTSVAVERHFMRGYPDGTFRGDQPFTRLQLALAVSELIKELEVVTKTSWATQGLGGYAFQDLPEDAETKAIVLNMANRYRLFEGVPGVTSRTLEADKQVTRYEMAKVVNRLLRLGEERGLVNPAVQQPQIHLFTDVPASAWAYNEVKEVADRYQVMIGFPDATFRGPEELTRYQFAASAAQTFPMVRQLVEKSQEPKTPTEKAEAVGARYLEATPLWLGVTGRFNGPVGPGVQARYAHYFGSPLFVLADVGLGNQLASGERLYGGALAVGWAFPLGSSFHLQPYLGGRAVSTGANTAGGLTYGALAYARGAESPLGWYLNANGNSALGSATGVGQGAFFGGASTGLEFYLNPRLAITAEVGYGLQPSFLAPASAGASDAAIQGTLGVQFGL